VIPPGDKLNSLEVHDSYYALHKTWMTHPSRAGLSRVTTLVATVVTIALAAGLALWTTQKKRTASTRTVRVQVSEGTWLAFDVSPDHRNIAFDLLGQLWVTPAGGGDARAITDAVRDSSDDDDPSFAPDGKSIVFAGERSGHAGLWRLDLASHEVERLTVAPQSDGQPAWSPDGRTIAFVRQMAERRGERVVGGAWLHLYEVTSRAVRRIPLGADGAASIRDPAWSADGRSLYVVAPREGTPDPLAGGALWSVDVATGAWKVVADSTLAVLSPSPSPDGQTLAFVARDSLGRHQVWMRPVGGGAPRQLTSEVELTPRRVRWAGPDTVLFVSGGRFHRLAVASGARAELPFVATIAFSRARPALPERPFPTVGERPAARGQTGLALAPDGKQAAVIALRRLWIIPIPSGTTREVSRLPEGARDVEWSPSMDRVVYAAGSWGDEDLHVLELETARDVRITDLPGLEVAPAWSPDGRWIAFIHAAPDSAAHLFAAPVGNGEPAPIDRKAIHDLGPIGAAEWTVGIATALRPAWRPDSRALLAWRRARGPILREPFAALRASSANVIPLEGKPHPLANFPFDATWVRWVDDSTLTYVEADRLMRAHVRGDSVVADAPESLGADAALYMSAARDGSLLYVSGDGLRVRRPTGTVEKLGWPVTYTVPTPPPMIVRNARVIDGTGSPATAPQDLLLRNGRIERLATRGTLDTAGMQVVDAGGGVVMPGLADLHSHQDGPDQMRGALYFGVTLLRDQGSDLATVAARADEALSGDAMLPRTTYGGFQMYTDWAFNNGIEQGLEPERDSGQMRRSVELLRAHGAEHMKIRTFYGWNGAARLIDAAHRAGMRTTGHCIFPLILLSAGMDAKEHLGNNCGDRFNAPLHEDVIAVLRASGVSVVPTTMVYSWQDLWIADSGFLRRPDVAPFTVAMKRNAQPWATLDTAYWIGGQGGIMVAQARALHNAGIPLGVGCDAPQLPWGPHLEMERLVRAGLTPLEAIRAATLESMRIVGHDGELGTIASGKIADLVILEPDAEPWRDIRDTRRIRTVILGGRAVDRDALLRPDVTPDSR
jgi:Tol biopolymer transport system component